MDYESKYRNLKEYILQSQSDRKIDPSVVDKFVNFRFIYKDKELSNAAHVVVMSLISDFMKLSDIRGNIEISKHYAIGDGLEYKDGKIVCENCELVLRYQDDPICWSEGKIVDKNTVDCHLSRGLITLAVKTQKGSDSWKYTDISVVQVDKTNDLSKYANKPYPNTQGMKDIHQANQAAHTHSFTEILEQKGGAQLYSASDIDNALYNLNDFATKIKQGALKSQLPSITSTRATSSTPDSHAIHLAKIIAEGTDSDHKTFVVPGDHSVPLHKKSGQVSAVTGHLSPHGVKIQTAGGNNTINSKVASRRVSMRVDSTVAVVPTSAAEQQVTVSPNFWDKVSEAWKSFVNNVQSYADQIKGNAVPVSDKVAYVEPKSWTDDVKQAYVQTETQAKKSFDEIKKNLESSNVTESIKKPLEDFTNKLSEVSKSLGESFSNAFKYESTN